MGCKRNPLHVSAIFALACISLWIFAISPPKNGESDKRVTMLDSHLRPLIDPPLNRMGKSLASAGISANMVTAVGLAMGLMAAVAIAMQAFALALVLVAMSRLADGLDGAVARATKLTDFGGYFDLVADTIFYAAVPLAFVWIDPAGNGMAAGFMITAFYVNGATFLGYAALAEKARMTTQAQGRKSIYFSNGLLEGTETIGFFLFLCLFPALFAPAAWVFGALCLVTAGIRVWQAAQVFGGGR
jgi:phosphatidylglycerophosphate synthase